MPHPNLPTQKAVIKILTIERNGNRTSYKTDALGWPSTFDPIVAQTLQQDKTYEVEYTVKPNPSGGRDYKNIVKVLQELPSQPSAPVPAEASTSTNRSAKGSSHTSKAYGGAITGRDECRMIRMNAATNATSLVNSLITTGKLEGDLDLVLETVKAFTDQLAKHVVEGLESQVTDSAAEAMPAPAPAPVPAPQPVPVPAQVPHVPTAEAQATFKATTTSAAIAARLAQIKQQAQAAK